MKVIFTHCGTCMVIDRLNRKIVLRGKFSKPEDIFKCEYSHIERYGERYTGVAFTKEASSFRQLKHYVTHHLVSLGKVEKIPKRYLEANKIYRELNNL